MCQVVKQINCPNPIGQAVKQFTGHQPISESQTEKLAPFSLDPQTGNPCHSNRSPMSLINYAMFL